MTDTFEKSRIDMPSDPFPAGRYDKLLELVWQPGSSRAHRETPADVPSTSSLT
jgi:hypothetical protein